LWKQGIFFILTTYPLKMKVKPLIPATLILLITIQCFAQERTDKLFFLEKAEKHRKMKKAGATLTVAGSVLTVAGVVILLNSTVVTEVHHGVTHTVTTGNRGLGTASFIVGMASAGSGIPLWIVGAKAQQKYEKKANILSVHVNPGVRGTGLTLAYRF
jgi:hypothetical protein